MERIAPLWLAAAMNDMGTLGDPNAFASGVVSYMPCDRVLRDWMFALWNVRFADKPLVEERDLFNETRSLAFDWTYKVAAGIWVPVQKTNAAGQKKKGHVNLVFILGTVVSHTGKVIDARLCPTEKFENMEAQLRPLFTRMKRAGIPAPEVIWVDDWAHEHVVSVDTASFG
eukprot:EG_transcript_30498